MSAAIAPLPGLHRSSLGPGGSLTFARRIPPGRTGLCAFLALLLWGLFGSLAMGLRSPATANPAHAMLWLAGAVVIAAVALVLGFLAGHAKS
ncbi:hypothetical protein VQH23_19390 [Pararoseomonas sp. SCSIO 73927]|uniref:hypothetical protein n=1 Tax=Pararoseomonas sp. SCSIO 73927 TaxID=3114537 RepID=UPI0030D1C6D6